MDIVIRPLEPADFRRGFLETLGSLAPVDLSPERAEELFHADERHQILTFVAEADGRVVGTASLLYEQKYFHAGGRVAHIEDVAVHRDYQRRGIGTQLVAHAAERAAEHGCYKVILNCHGHLTPFYERIGFKTYDVGMRKNLGG